MKMFLVSQPQGLLLVSSTEADNHETTLVVPELARPQVEYFRCLVDEGKSFKEHAVVRWTGPVSGDGDARHVLRALTAARPTIVSFIGEGHLPQSAEGAPVSETGTAASATVNQFEALDPTGEGSAYGMRVRKTGRFYTCEPLKNFGP